VIRKKGGITMKKRILAITLSVAMTILAIAPVGATEAVSENAEAAVFEDFIDEAEENVAGAEEITMVQSDYETDSEMMTADLLADEVEDADQQKVPEEMVNGDGDGWTLNSGVLTVTTQEALDKHEWTKDEITRLSVKEAVITSGIENVSEEGFYKCSALTQVKIPKTVKCIKCDCFEGCISLKNVDFENGSELSIIEGDAFYDCTSLENITLPETLVSIGSYAFAKTSIKSVDLPAGVVTLGAGAFYGCSSLKSIRIPGSVKKVPYKGFINCDSLEELILEEGIEEILGAAFYHCDSLESVKIPASVTSIDGYLSAEANHCGGFGTCKKLKTVYFEEGSKLVTLGQSAFGACSSLESINLPDSLTEIGSFAFNKCGLREIVIPDSVVSIGDRSFGYCPLDKITIGSGLSSLHGWAFSVSSSDYDYDSDGDGDYDYKQTILITDNKVALDYNWNKEGRYLVDKLTVKDNDDKKSSSSSKKKDEIKLDEAKEKEWKEYVSTVSVDKVLTGNSDTLIVGDTATININGVYLTLITAKGKAGSYDKGIISASKKGTIKLYSYVDGKKKKICKIKVEDPKPKAQVKVKVGKTKKGKLKGTKQTVKYTVSNNKIATVSSDGKVTGVKSGTTTLTAQIGKHIYKSEIVVE